MNLSHFFQDLWEDGRVPLLLIVTVIVSLIAWFRYRREVKRLHNQRGYDAHDPQLNQQAWANTKSDFRNFNVKSRRIFQIVEAAVLIPCCTLIAALMVWGAFYSGKVQWTMLGIGSAFALGAALLTRNLIEDWRDK